MNKRGTVTLAELLAVVGLLAIAATVLDVAVSRQRAAREEARRIQCRGNLSYLAKGMVTYTGEYGDNRFYPWLAGRLGCGTAGNPQFGGAEWLASLHWGRYPIVPDPLVYVCPSSADDNEKGALRGSIGCPGGKPLPPRAVSYTGMGDRSVGLYMASKIGKGASYATSKLAIRDDFPPEELKAAPPHRAGAEAGEEGPR